MKQVKDRPIAKKVATAVTAIAAVIALTAGGTLAYFTASEESHNVITSGGIVVEDGQWADFDCTVPFADVDGVMPGQSVLDVAKVSNGGQAPVWIRAKTETVVMLADGSRADSGDVSQVISIDFNEESWTLSDGWWYYDVALLAGSATSPLFEHVLFDGPGMGNVYQGCSVVVNVYVQAVQTANNGSTVLEAAGWPME